MQSIKVCQSWGQATKPVDRVREPANLQTMLAPLPSSYSALHLLVAVHCQSRRAYTIFTHKHTDSHTLQLIWGSWQSVSLRRTRQRTPGLGRLRVSLQLGIPHYKCRWGPEFVYEAMFMFICLCVCVCVCECVKHTHETNFRQTHLSQAAWRPVGPECLTRRLPKSHYLSWVYRWRRAKDTWRIQIHL